MSGWTIPGWFCSNPVCGVFNDEVKDLRDECRCCGKQKPEIQRRRESSETRTIKISASVTENEHVRYREAAERAGLSLSEFLVGCVERELKMRG